MMTSIRYLNIQRMSSEDGPGLRTTLFCKGCPLACQWCHNPESITHKKQVFWNDVRCIGCRSCERVCRNGAIELCDEGVLIDRRKCEGCFACMEACPTGALEGKGTDETPEHLCAELLKDRAYFGADGGVTISGGEALLQDGCVELMRFLKEQGVQTAADTCGMLFPQQLEKALPYCDLLLYDLKLASDAAHRQWTGQGNAMIRKNFARAAYWARAEGGRLWVRTPIIPGATDTEENISAIGAIIASAGGVERWELCAFNNLCVDKYRRLGTKWAFADVPLMTQTRMQALLEAARQTAACRDIRATGACKKEA